MKFGVALGLLNPRFHLEATREAERLGFESAWLPEHLIFPVDLRGSPHPGSDSPPVPASTPVYDCFAYLCFLAGHTTEIRLGSHVYNLALRHPFVGARAVQTLDLVSGGRAEFGVGAGWLEAEWRATGVDFRTRGRRLDEALAVCKRLWTEEAVAHNGRFYTFDPVVFEPKPIQKPWPPIHVGGESEAALRRAAGHGDGWIGLRHTVASVAPKVARLRELRAGSGRTDAPFCVTVMAVPRGVEEIGAWTEAGVDRLIVAPWTRSVEALDALRRFARVFDVGR
jgi:probable F420-dependent oxidoreductase